MLTPHLENLIWQGKAVYRSWATGGGAVFRVPVKKNSFIVIVGITWHPIMPTNRPPTFDSTNNDYRIDNTQGLFLYTTKNRWYHNFRANYTLNFNPVDAAAPAIVTGGTAIRIPCYFIADENVRGNVCRVRNEPDTWANQDFAPMPPTSDELDIAEGYQTSAGASPSSTLKNWNFALAGDAAIYPTADQQPLAAVNDQDAFYEFKNKNANIQMNNPGAMPAADQNGINYPLINFDYVEIFGLLPQEMRK